MSSDEEMDDDIQEYFDKDEWEEMSAYEKKHFSNMKRNYEAMIASGLNPRPPSFMASKKSVKIQRPDTQKTFEEDGISAHGDPQNARSSEENNTARPQLSCKEDNSPNQTVDLDAMRSSTCKTSDQFSPEQMKDLTKRYKEIDLMVDQKVKEWKAGENRKLERQAKPQEEGEQKTEEHEAGKEEKPKTEEHERGKDEKSKTEEHEPGKDEKSKTKKRKSRKNEECAPQNSECNGTEKPAPGNFRYPRRQVPRKNYKEPKDLDEDDFLFCDDCNREYAGPCPKHGPLKFMKNRKVPKDGSVSDRAFHTIPQGLSICPSSIKGAGNGVWADIPLQKGVVFGPYDGVITDKAQKAQESGYSWAVYKGGKPQRYVDAEDTSKSNWLRFVNCADCEERQNLIAFQYKGKIFYRTYKKIDIGTEFLVWYGDEYAKELGISTEEKDPPHAQNVDNQDSKGFECVQCGVLFTNGDALVRHKKYKHWSEKNAMRYKCQYCTYTSNCRNNVSKHERTHTGVKPYKCPQCGKGFSQAGDLSRHRLCHTGEKPYSCDICCKSFRHHSTLIAHKSAHHFQKKNHMCKSCGKTFVQKGQMLIHERIHNGQRPYKCDQCSKRFVSSSSLKEHVICNHTRNFPHKCLHCNKGFVAPVFLRRHQKVHHLNEE